MISPIQHELISIDHAILPSWEEKQVQVGILRLDRMHDMISGNKWFKLRFYLQKAIEEKKDTVITFGGAWSNHILATAAACQLAGLQSIGIIRGENPAKWSDTLLAARECGMELYFLSREDFRLKKIPAELKDLSACIIPEGGFGPLGRDGASTIADYVKGDWTHTCCAVGTGTMLAGLASAGLPGCVGINVLRNPAVNSAIQALTRPGAGFSVIHDYHFGGYAKFNDELIQFMNAFYKSTGIPSDFVYTGKLFYAINDLVRSGYFPTESKILVVHSGGLQGNSSLEKGKLMW